MRLSPEAPVPIVELRQTVDIPGGAANVATNIRSTGAQVALVGVFGRVAAADRLSRRLEEAGLCSEFLMRSASRQTTTKTRVLVQKHQIVRIDDETAHTMCDDDENSLRSLIAKAIDGSDVVVLSDYAKGCLSPATIAAVVSEARKAEIPVIVDPKGRNYQKYHGATLLTPNLNEAMLAAGLEFDGDGSVDAAAEKLLGEIEIGSLLITLGERGMKLFDRGSEPLHFPSTARSVYDVTGAGDTVVAFLAASVGAGAAYDPAIRIANIAAGLAVEKVGTAVISKEQLRTAIKDGR
jgi:D-beta-D-heptose 7-phosphate kinase/D-beta-D-heptose 1-phosphate adenosyltransferase